jgi:DUF1365 family protein
MSSPTPLDPTLAPQLAPAQPLPPAANRALIGIGEVLHRRMQPLHHAFRYPVYFLLLPMRSLRRDGFGALPRSRFGWLSFHDADHGDGGPDALAWLEALLTREGVQGVDGEIWLHCFPRMLGFAFKPVSFWYCHRQDGSLAAVVAEVNNTFGERHCYLLRPPAGADSLAWGQTLTLPKRFHVSPFCAVEGRYHFRFLRSPGHTASAEGAAAAAADAPGNPPPAAPPRTVVRIDLDDAQGRPLLSTSVSGRLEPATAASLRRAAWRFPWQSLGVWWRIHLQAWRLWRGGVPFFRKPSPPALPVTSFQTPPLGFSQPLPPP